MSHMTNPGGLLGDPAQYGPQTTDVLAANSISAQELVALSTSPGYVIRNLVATGAGLQFGVAKSDIASGKAGTIITGGWVVVKKGTAALTAGNAVKADATVSGAVGVASAATAITTVGDARGIVGTVVADASAAATTVTINFGKF